MIVDTPPVALLPDANLLAAMIDTALLVVGANSTPYPLVRRAIEAIGEQRILGVVLNRLRDAELIAGYSYYGYGSYGYGYGYGLRRPKRLVSSASCGVGRTEATGAPKVDSGTPLECSTVTGGRSF